MKKSKLNKIEDILLKDRVISNVETLNGTNGVRTNRLGAFIHTLRDKYEIETKEVRKDGQYVDCLYRLLKKK